MGWIGRKPECLFNHFEAVVAKSNTDEHFLPFVILLLPYLYLFVVICLYFIFEQVDFFTKRGLSMKDQ
jgi:hypothetical protein